MATILIVEDDKNTRILTVARLRNEYNVVWAENGEKALEIMEQQHIDLIVSDVMMPIMDGYELIKLIRESGNTIPIILLTAKEEFSDKKVGFASGTDDYLTKPINYEELIWRIQALLRRANIAAEKKIHLGKVTLDANRYCVIREGGTEQELPKKEFEMLYKLLSYPGVIFTKSQLLDEIWGYESESDENTIKTHISRLRSRFEEWEEFRIVTVRGLGYKGECL